MSEKNEPVPKEKLTLQTKIGAVIGFLIIIISIFFFSKWIHYRYTHSVTNNAFIQTDMAELSSLVSGHIKQLLADEGDYVKKGQVVAVIDDRDYKAQVELSRAQRTEIMKKLDKAKITLLRLQKNSNETIAIAKRGIIEALDLLKKAKVNQEKLKKDFHRHETLSKNRVVAQRKFDAIDAEYKASTVDVSVATTRFNICEDKLAQAKLTEIQVKEAEKDILSLMAAAETAARHLDIATLNLEHTKIKSRQSGVVAKKYFDQGDYISRGAPVFSIYDKNNIFVEANLEETKTKGVKPGNGVDLWVDAYHGEKLRGKVIKVGMAAGREFALIPRDVSSGEFTKVVQRIPIEITAETSEKFPLKPGMSVKVGIELN